MTRFSESRLKELAKIFKKKRIAVVGDIMVDKYVWGRVLRISPEAPVPVVEIEKETERLGGAANVANNITSLGGEPILVGVVGNDANGATLTRLLAEQGCQTIGIITDASRPTTIKTRVIAHNQHVVRIDHEQKSNISASAQEQILSVLRRNIGSIDGIIFQDYNKGAITAALIQQIVTLAKERGTIVTVDPKFQNFFEYKDVSVFKPNRKEVEEALGTKLNSEHEVREALISLKNRLNAENVLITRGEDGMSLLNHEGVVEHFPTRARHVADVSGAGDTVIATLTMALASGATIQEATSMSNFAGGIVCGEVGIVPIMLEVLIKTILTYQS